MSNQPLLRSLYEKLNGESIENKKKEFDSGETAERGRIIIVDPRRTVTVKTAEKLAGKENVLHLQLKPGTDVTLMNGLVTYIVEKSWKAKNFKSKHTENFEQAYKRNAILLLFAHSFSVCMSPGAFLYFIRTTNQSH